jgi:phosphatidylglycerophosphate synthase
VLEPHRADAELTEGERWTREQLRALLARRFTPAALARFLWESSRRSASVRRQRPAVARRARRWTVAGGLAWLVLAAGGIQPFRRRLRLGLGWWSATALMLDWHLGMLETEDGRPRNLGAADALTLTRAWLIPVALDAPTPTVCALAAATDALDGPAARRAGPTRAGRDLEGLVDACFAAAALRGAVRHGWLPPAVAGAELVRLGVGLGYAVMVYFGAARAPSRELLRAARLTSAVRAGGLVLAGTARRRAGGALIVAGSVTSVALAVAVATRGAHSSMSYVHGKMPPCGRSAPESSSNAACACSTRSAHPANRS